MMPPKLSPSLPHFRRFVARQRNLQVDEMILYLRRSLLEQALKALLSELRRQDHRDAVVAVKEGQLVGERGSLRLQGTAVGGKRFETADFLGQGDLVLLQDMRGPEIRFEHPGSHWQHLENHLAAHGLQFRGQFAARVLFHVDAGENFRYARVAEAARRKRGVFHAHHLRALDVHVKYATIIFTKSIQTSGYAIGHPADEIGQ